MCIGSFLPAKLYSVLFFFSQSLSILSLHCCLVLDQFWANQGVTLPLACPGNHGDCTTAPDYTGYKTITTLPSRVGPNEIRENMPGLEKNRQILFSLFYLNLRLLWFVEMLQMHWIFKLFCFVNDLNVICGPYLQGVSFYYLTFFMIICLILFNNFWVEFLVLTY